MTRTGLPSLQPSVITRLKASDMLAALGAAVFDAIPQAQPFPYVVFDVPFEVPNRYLGQDGHDITFTLSVFTQDGSATKLGKGSAGFKLSSQIVDVLMDELTDLDNPISVDGHDLVDLDLISVEYAREADGITRRADVNLMATLEDTLP